MNVITVLLIDSHVHFRQQIMHFIQEHATDYVTVVDAIGWSEAGAASLSALQPDVVLFGVSSAALWELQQLPRLRAALPHAAIIVLSVLDTDAYRQLAMDFGAAAFLPKDALAAELLPLLARGQRHGAA